MKSKISHWQGKILSRFFKKIPDPPVFPYAGRDHFHSLLDIGKDDTVFVGDSHFSMFPLEEMFHSLAVKNRAHGGSTSFDLLHRIRRICECQPRRIFISVGTNDIVQNIGKEQTLHNLRECLQIINDASPGTGIYLMSPLPVWKNKTSINAAIHDYNNEYRHLCDEEHIQFVNVFDILSDEEGYLQLKYTGDGVHLNGYGYIELRNHLIKYLDDENYKTGNSKEQS